MDLARNINFHYFNILISIRLQNEINIYMGDDYYACSLTALIPGLFFHRPFLHDRNLQPQHFGLPV